MRSKAFDNFAGLLSILAGVTGFAYAVSFVIISKSDPSTGALLSGKFLELTGILVIAPLIALYQRFKDEGGYALWAFIFGVAGALGRAVHGGYDLANALNPSTNLPALANLPSQSDPRGLLTFGLSGLALFTFSWLIDKNRTFPKNLAYLGYFSAILSLILYVGRLTLLDPANPIILYPALINGFVANPLFYLWLGMRLRK